MPVFGSNQLLRNISQMAQDHNRNLENELNLLYAPDETQVKAVVDARVKDMQYERQKQESMERAFASHIGAASGMDTAGATALARMMGPSAPTAPPPSPLPPPPMPDMPPEEFKPQLVKDIGQGLGWLGNIFGGPTELTPPVPPMLPSVPDTPLFMPDIGAEDIGVLPTPGIPQEFKPQLVKDIGQGLGMLSDAALPSGRGFPLPSVPGFVQDIPARFAEWGLPKPSGVLEKPASIVEQQRPQADLSVAVAPSDYRVDAINSLRQAYGTLSTLDKLLAITRIIRESYDPNNPEGIELASGELYRMLRSAETDEKLNQTVRNLVRDVTAEVKQGIRPEIDATGYRGDVSVDPTYATGPRDGVTDVPSGTVMDYTRADDTRADGTRADGTRADDMDVPVYQSEAPTSEADLVEQVTELERQQPEVKGDVWLEWLSSLNEGKKRIYDFVQSTDPRFSYMAPAAKSIYDGWEGQLRYQYNLEVMNPDSPWSRLDEGISDVVEQANSNYHGYLNAAFNPQDTRASLWSRSDWQNNLQALYQNEFAGKGKTLVGEAFGTDRPPTTLGAMPGEQAVPRPLMSLFESYAADPSIVIEWIVAKSLKGANPIIAKYGPDAIRRDANRWLMENFERPDISSVPPGQHPAADASRNQKISRAASASIMEEWAKRDFKWFGPRGYGTR